jgi:hypothetical protein
MERGKHPSTGPCDAIHLLRFTTRPPFSSFFLRFLGLARLQFFSSLTLYHLGRPNRPYSLWSVNQPLDKDRLLTHIISTVRVKFSLLQVHISRIISCQKYLTNGLLATKKVSDTGANERFFFAVSEMQGWRISESFLDTEHKLDLSASYIDKYSQRWRMHTRRCWI